MTWIYCVGWYLRFYHFVLAEITGKQFLYILPRDAQYWWDGLWGWSLSMIARTRDVEDWIAYTMSKDFESVSLRGYLIWWLPPYNLNPRLSDWPHCRQLLRKSETLMIALMIAISYRYDNKILDVLHWSSVSMRLELGILARFID